MPLLKMSEGPVWYSQAFSRHINREGSVTPWRLLRLSRTLALSWRSEQIWGRQRQTPEQVGMAGSGSRGCVGQTLADTGAGGDHWYVNIRGIAIR